LGENQGPRGDFQLKRIDEGSQTKEREKKKLFRKRFTDGKRRYYQGKGKKPMEKGVFPICMSDVKKKKKNAGNFWGAGFGRGCPRLQGGNGFSTVGGLFFFLGGPGEGRSKEIHVIAKIPRPDPRDGAGGGRVQDGEFGGEKKQKKKKKGPKQKWPARGGRSRGRGSKKKKTPQVAERKRGLSGASAGEGKSRLKGEGRKQPEWRA